MEPLRWGIVGCGDICEKAVAPCMLALDNCQLMAGMRRDAAALAAFADRFGVERTYRRYEDLLADPEVEAVYVATPPAHHAEQTAMAAAAGKHVLCEKPMAMNASEARQMIAACRDAGVKLGVSFYRRYFPQIEAALAVVAQGEIGQVCFVRSHNSGYSPGPETGGWRFVPELSGGGALMDVGSHRVDLVVLFGGEITRAHGFAQRGRGWEVDDAATALVEFASGVQGVVAVDWNSRPGSDIFEIHGAEGRILMPNLAGDTLIVQSGDGTRTVKVEPLSAQDRDMHLLDHFVQWARGAGEFRVPGEEGLKTMEVIDAVYAAG